MTRAATAYGAGAVAAILFGWLSIWNGYPLVYQDTLTYLERPATAMKALAGVDDVWANPAKVARLAPGAAKAGGYAGSYKRGRSIYYGAAAYLLDLAGGLWAVVAAQAVLVAVTIALVYFRCLGLTSLPGFVVTIAAIATASSAALFANLVMPDVLTGIVVLDLAMLCGFWHRLHRGDRIFVVSSAVVAIIAHDTHLLVAAAVVGASLAARLATRRVAWPALGVALGVVAVGVAAGMAFDAAVLDRTGQAPVRLPFMTAHLVGKPVLARFLATHCDGDPAPWHVCAYRGRLPLNWIDFLFDNRPTGTFAIAAPDARLAISREDVPLMLAVMRDAPGATAAALITDAGRQLGAFTLADLSQRDKAGYIDLHFPPAVRSSIHATRLWASNAAIDGLSRLQVAGVVVSLPVIGLAVLGLSRRRDGSAEPYLLLTWLVAAGVVGNAVVCGVLASPYDRFQARVVWLVPLLALTGTSLYLARRKAAVPSV